MASSLRRKPVPSRPPASQNNEEGSSSPPCQPEKRELQDSLHDAKAIIDPSALDGESSRDLETQLENLQLYTDNDDVPPLGTDSDMFEGPAKMVQERGPSDQSSKLKIAFDEIKHFAGGLIAHPYEATKHFSILRHSHGLVYYQGPSTSVAMTVFSDQPLPADRKLWLQKRGFSGKAGMKIGSLGSRSAWIDVTPAMDATMDSLPSNDERAWQRDITKFLKEAKDIKAVRGHQPSETNIVRIPHQTEDGYFRIVLCAGRKVLCPSPVFRYASSSTDPSILRGASLTSLPVELGIKIGSYVARNAASTATHGVLQPVTNSIQTATQPYQLGGLTQVAARATYDFSGAQSIVDGTIASVDQTYNKERDLEFTIAVDALIGGADIIGSDDGPEQPYPIRFSGKTIAGDDRSNRGQGVQTLKLTNVPEDTALRLSGVYMGWASIAKSEALEAAAFSRDLLEQWFQALVTVIPAQGKQASVVQRNSVSVTLLHDFGLQSIPAARLNVMLMALLHPAMISTDSNSHQEQTLVDIATTERSLNRTAWLPYNTLERIKSASSERSFTERLAGVRSAGQRQINRVPIHKLGVRMNSMRLKDELIGNGGLCVRR